MGVDWTSEEGSDLVEPPLNLVLYMNLRIFEYGYVRGHGYQVIWGKLD